MVRMFVLAVLLSSGCALLGSGSGTTTARVTPDDSCLDISHDCAVCLHTLDRFGENLTQRCEPCEEARKCKGRK